MENIKTVFEISNEYLSICVDEVLNEEGNKILLPHFIIHKWNRKVKRYSQQLCLALYDYFRKLGYSICATQVEIGDTKHMKFLSMMGNWKETSLTVEGMDDYIIFILDLNKAIGEEE